MFYVQHGSLNELLLYFLEAICVTSVNIFVLISGYFSCYSTKKTILKPLKLIIQVIFFNLIFYFVSVLTGSIDLSLRHILVKILPCNYFVILYSAVYLVSPFVNMTVSKLTNKSFTTLIVISFLLFSVEPCLFDLLEGVAGRTFPGLCTISFQSGSGAGYTFVNFMLLYLVGAYLRRMMESKQVSSLPLFLLFLIITVIIMVWHYCLPESIALIGDEYHNPLIIISAATIFLIFKNSHIKQSKIINRFAKAAFTVYLCHGWCIQFFNIRTAVEQPTFILFLHIIITCCTIYFAGWLVSETYFRATNWFFKLISNNKIIFNIEARSCDEKVLENSQ